MTGKRSYDDAIIGAGQAGIPLATSLAAAGRQVALVERAYVGGSCINYGCTPSKTLIASARTAYLARRAADYGISATAISVDMPAVYGRKQDVVESWRSGSRRMLEKTANLDLLMGEASFLGPLTLRVQALENSAETSGEVLQLEAERIFINSGCRPAVPEVPGLETVDYLDSTTIMELDQVPEHLLIMGGGYVALEFGQMFRRFGSQVTIVERAPTVMAREDPDISEALVTILQEDGIALHLNTDVREVGGQDGQVELMLGGNDGSSTLTGSHLLVATGRTPNTEALDLGAAGIETDQRGYIPVNDRLETRIPGVYALGDVNGGPAFTHVSYDDYRVVRANLLGEGGGTTKDRLLCYVMYTDPELGRVGLTERQARERGLEVKVYSLSMGDVPRAIETGETRGLMKAVVDSKNDRILGCAILGIQGGEMMSAIQLAIMGSLESSRLRDSIFAHPALAEAFNMLFDQ